VRRNFATASREGEWFLGCAGPGGWGELGVDSGVAEEWVKVAAGRL